MSNIIFLFLFVISLWLPSQVVLGQSLYKQNLLMNPGLEDIYMSIERIIDGAIAFRMYKRQDYDDLLNIDTYRIRTIPLKWEKFCTFSGAGYCSNIEGHARTGDCYMQLNVAWGPNFNKMYSGKIAARLHHPLAPGCDYRFGIWVAKSVEDPERVNTVTLTVRGLQGKARNLIYTPKDTVYLQFEIPIHEMKIGDYRYYEGEFKSLSDATHLLIEANSDDFLLRRKARRIHRKCNNLKGSCGNVKLASVTIDDVSLSDISGCRDEPLDLEARQDDFITLSAFQPDRVKKDTSTFFFQHDHPYLSKEELERLMQFYEEMDGQILSIHGYTDTSGRIVFNRELSELRAHKIIEELQKMNTNVKAKVAGHGLCGRDSCVSEAECRRVYIIWRR